MRRSDDTFRFTAELGARLRGLRLAEGMTQQELAVLMGRQGKGNAFLISRLETGRVPFPSAGIESGSTVAFRLRLYARKLWGVLRASRRKLKRKQEELERWAAASGLSGLPVFAALTARISELAAQPTASQG